MMQWQWYTGPVDGKRCERCNKLLRLDSQLIQFQENRTFHLPCFLDHAIEQMSAAYLRNASGI